jgi:hypothetical protein
LSKEHVWPYVLPFPTDAKQRRLVWSILQSRVGMSVLTKLKLDGRTYQRELIKQTSYSNKSIIEYLKKMVKAGILEEGFEQVSTRQKRIWIKWYVPTQLGKWFILFLKNPDEIPSDLARKTLEELFKLYASSIVEVSEKYGLSLDFFHQILNKHYSKGDNNKA